MKNSINTLLAILLCAGITYQLQAQARTRKVIEEEIKKTEMQIARTDKGIQATTNTQDRARLQKNRQEHAEQLKKLEAELKEAK